MLQKLILTSNTDQGAMDILEAKKSDTESEDFSNKKCLLNSSCKNPSVDGDYHFTGYKPIRNSLIST